MDAELEKPQTITLKPDKRWAIVDLDGETSVRIEMTAWGSKGVLLRVGDWTKLTKGDEKG